MRGGNEGKQEERKMQIDRERERKRKRDVHSSLEELEGSKKFHH